MTVDPDTFTESMTARGFANRRSDTVNPLMATPTSLRDTQDGRTHPRANVSRNAPTDATSTRSTNAMSRCGLGGWMHASTANESMVTRSSASTCGGTHTVEAMDEDTEGRRCDDAR